MERKHNGVVLVSCVYFADCNAPGTEDNPIANRPCLPLLNLVINYGQMGLKLLLGVINIFMGVAFVKELMAAKIRNVVSSTDWLNRYLLLEGILTRPT